MSFISSAICDNKIVRYFTTTIERIYGPGGSSYLDVDYDIMVDKINSYPEPLISGPTRIDVPQVVINYIHGLQEQLDVDEPSEEVLELIQGCPIELDKLVGHTQEELIHGDNPTNTIELYKATYELRQT